MEWQMAVAGFLVAGLGFGLGATFAFLFCLSKKQIIAISIETAFQNGGVVFILLKLSLPSPDRWDEPREVVGDAPNWSGEVRWLKRW